MNADDVIDSYVRDVARQLPPKRRNDVAFELRALLTDDLRGRAEAEGRAPDADMAVAMVRAFGRPSQTATRYYQPFTIIEPSDTWSFLVATVAGAAVITLLASPRAPGTYPDMSRQASAALLARSALVVVFGVKNLILRYRPHAFAWKPRPVRDTYRASLAAVVMLALSAAALVLYLAPGRVVAALSGGRVAAETLAYSDSFTSPLRMPWLAGLLVLVIGLYVLVVVQGRWRPATRWARIALTAAIAVQLGWHARYGAIFQDPRTDALLVPAIAVAAGLILVACGSRYTVNTAGRPARSRTDPDHERRSRCRARDQPRARRRYLRAARYESSCCVWPGRWTSTDAVTSSANFMGLSTATPSSFRKRAWTRLAACSGSIRSTVVASSAPPRRTASTRPSQSPAASTIASR